MSSPITDRTASDGRPFYCLICRSGFADFMACELLCCQLESPDEAHARHLRHAALAAPPESRI